MTLGLDYSGGRPAGAAVFAAGYRFVARYLVNGLSGTRFNLTAAEAADMRSHGVDVVVVWERKIIGQPDRATEGASAGTADAKASDAQCNAVGLAGWPVYLAVDFDIPDYAPASADPRAKLGPVGDYLAAARDVLGIDRMGVYGGYWAVKRALDAGLVRWAWQTAAWSGGNVDPRVHLFQRLGTVTVGGVDCDVDEAKQAQFGQAVVVGPATKGTDDMIDFYVDGGQRKADGTFPDAAVLMRIGGLLYPSSWAQYTAKKAEGVATLTGLDTTGPGSFADVKLATADQRAIPGLLAALISAVQAEGGTGTGTGGLTRADVTGAVADALVDVEAKVTYDKITGS